MVTRFGFRINKDPMSWATHFAGLLAAVAGTLYLVMWSIEDPTKAGVMGFYGATLISVFLASSAYHFFDFGERWNLELRRLDHIAIYLLIAGSYAPAVVHLLRGWHRVAVIGVIALLCAIGIGTKIFWMHAPEWISVSIYLGIAWLGVIPAVEMIPQLTAWSASCLVFGGGAYTVGAVVFAREWPDPWPQVFGHHEIWHVFVLVGALGHFLFAASLLDVPIPAF